MGKRAAASANQPLAEANKELAAARIASLRKAVDKPSAAPGTPGAGKAAPGTPGAGKPAPGTPGTGKPAPGTPVAAKPAPGTPVPAKPAPGTSNPPEGSQGNVGPEATKPDCTPLKPRAPATPCTAQTTKSKLVMG